MNRERMFAAAGALVLAVVMTWPVAAKWSSGARIDSTDAMYAMWNVAWVARALTSDPLNVFNANIFHPHPGTLAYSEGNIGAGVLAIPGWLLTRNVYATYNTAVLLGYALSFFCTYLLVRRLTGSRVAAAAAGMAFAYAPYMFARFPHIQLQMTFGMPLVLLAFHRLLDQRRIADGVLLGVALVVAVLSSAYYGILIGLVIGAGTIYYAIAAGLWRDRRFWIAIAIALVTLGALMAPFLPPYMQIREEGFERTLDEARRLSVNWRGWLASGLRPHRWLLMEDFRGVAFPGVTRVMLGLAGLLALAFAARTRAVFTNGRLHAGFYLLAGVLVFWASFGPQAGLYAVLHNTLPFFAFLRAVERFAIFVTLVLCVGLGFAVAALKSTWLAGWSRRAKVAAAALLFLAIAIDSWGVPVFYPDALPVPRVYRALARAERGPVAEFPFFYRGIDFNRHGYYMLMSTYHWQPLINGYSDHYPKQFFDALPAFEKFPTEPAAFDRLREHGARYIVVHLDWYEHRRRPEVEQALAHYVSQGVLRFLDADKREDAAQYRGWDVALYELLR